MAKSPSIIRGCLAALTVIALIAIGVPATAASDACHAPEGWRVEQVALGEGAPLLQLRFRDDPTARPQAEIRLEGDAACRLLTAGRFRHGSLLSGRGAKGNRYRLIDETGIAHDLIWTDGTFALLRGSRIEHRYRL